MAADLSFDDRRREGGEGDAAVFVEAVGGLDQAHRADLHQVIQGLTAPGEATGNRMRQREVRLDEAIACAITASRNGRLRHCSQRLMSFTLGINSGYQ